MKLLTHALFHFQANKIIEVKTPEELARWEQYMLEEVGVRPEPKILSGAKILSCCGKYGEDDCGYSPI